MSSAYVETYMTPGGKHSKPKKRYRVRARARNTETRLMHLGSFQTRSEAEDRAKWARSLLARGIIPNVETNLFPQQQAAGVSVSVAVKRYIDQRPDLAETTKRSYRSLSQHIDRELGRRGVRTITPNDVRELVETLIERGLTPAPILQIRGILKGALANQDVDPNPASHPSVKVPTRPSERLDVPPAKHLEAILRHVPDALVVPIAMIEATGARVSELYDVQHGDVDRENLKLRLVGKGDKPRVVPLPAELAARIPNGELLERVWPQATPWGVRRAMATACKAAKIPHYHPHDLRHRYASRLVHQGVPVTQISLWMGHSRTSITHDIYADVIADSDEAWRAVIHE